MGGVGSFSRENRTLYVSGLRRAGPSASASVAVIEGLVRPTFSEFGTIESIKCLPDKLVAFVKFKWRASAEFAKEAMHERSLKHCDEV
jgi:hypothetical protein